MDDFQVNLATPFYCPHRKVDPLIVLSNQIRLVPECLVPHQVARIPFPEGLCMECCEEVRVVFSQTFNVQIALWKLSRDNLQGEIWIDRQLLPKTSRVISNRYRVDLALSAFWERFVKLGMDDFFKEFEIGTTPIDLANTLV
jgi:hypothetical protein